MSRLRYNNQQGILGAILGSGGTTITFQVIPSFATLVAPDYIVLVLEPGTINEEIVYLTAYTSGQLTGTVVRNQEGSPSSLTHALATTWQHGPTSADFWTRNVIVQAANYTAKNGDVVLANATSGAIALTLPAVAANLQVIVKKTDNSANKVTVTPQSGTIDGAANFVIWGQYHSITFVSDGTNWFVTETRIMDGNGNVAAGSYTASVGPYVPSPSGGIQGPNFATDQTSGPPALGVNDMSGTPSVIEAGVNNGAQNTAAGQNALAANTIGAKNTAFGYHALQSNTGGVAQFQHGSWNTALGTQALQANTTGEDNTAVGSGALFSCTTGHDNTVVGLFSGSSITTGAYNTLMGENVGVGLGSTTPLITGINNTAVGQNTLGGDGSNNTAIGGNALYAQTTGQRNTVVGRNAGSYANNVIGNATTTASDQTIIGHQAGQSSSTQAQGIVAVGANALAGRDYNIAIGYGVLAQAAGAVAIGVDSTGAAPNNQTIDRIQLGTGLSHLLLGNPGGGQGAWKFGKLTAGAITLNANNYVEVMVDGTIHKLLVSL